MSVYTNFTTIIGLRIPVEKRIPDFDYQQSAEKAGLHIEYIDPMSDSDIIVGTTLFSFIDDGYPDEESLLVEIDYYPEVLLSTSTKLDNFIQDYNNKTDDSDLKLEKNVAIYSFVSYG